MEVPTWFGIQQKLIMPRMITQSIYRESEIVRSISNRNCGK